MRRHPFTLLALLSSALLPACQAGSSEAKVDPEVAMTRMMELGQPSIHHEHLKRLAGNWTCEVTTWMEPGAEPETMTASSRNEMVLGGRYLKQTFQGDFMGQPFEGLGFMGYDNASACYWSTWMDSMSTFMLPQTSGECSPDGRTFTLEGTWYNPFIERDQQDRHVLELVDDNHYTFDMYVSYPGQDEFHSMHIDYKRR